MSAIALEAPQLVAAPVAAPRRPRQARGPVARPTRLAAPVGAPAVPHRVAGRGAARAAGCRPGASAAWHLTPRGIAVVTGATLLTTATGLVTVVAQFLAIPA